MPTTAIDRLTLPQIPQAHVLLQESLGTLYTEASLRALSVDPGAVLLGAWQQDQLLGVALGEQVPLHRCEPLYRGFGAKVPAHLVLRRLGQITALVVVPTAQRSGLGRALIAEMVAGLLLLDCTYLVAIAWVPKDPGHFGSEPILQKTGFSLLGESTMGDLAPLRRCSRCPQACDCLAKLYGRGLDVTTLVGYIERR